MKRKAFVLAAAAVTGVPQIAATQTLTTSDAIARLFTAPPIQAAWFTPLFLAAAPLSEVKSIVAALIETLGPYQSIAPNGKGYTITFARGTVQATAALDANSAFSGLLISRMQSAPAAARVSAVFSTSPIPADWFSARMLAAVPITQIRAITAAIETQYGPFQTAVPAPDGTYTVTFAHGSAAVTIYLGPDGKIEGLIAQPH